MAIYDIDGNRIDSTQTGGSVQLPYMSINHKGWTKNGAAANSLNAFKQSYEHGFRAVETDVRYSSDNVPVLSHDATYSNLTIAETTYADLKTAGITSLEELIDYCKQTGLIPYLELKINDNSMTDYAISVVAKYGMMRDVVWISAYWSAVSYVVSVCEYANVRVQGGGSTTPSGLSALATGKNTVGAYFGTAAAGSGIDASVTIPVAKAGYVVGGCTYSSQSANMLLDSERGATEFTTDYTKAEDVLSQ